MARTVVVLRSMRARGGHGVGLIDDISSVAELVDRLEAEYGAAREMLSGI